MSHFSCKQMTCDSSTSHRTILRQKATSDLLAYHDDVATKNTETKEAVDSYDDTYYTTTKLKLPTLAGGMITTNM